MAAGAANFVNFEEEHFEVGEGGDHEVAGHEDYEEEEGEGGVGYFDEPFVDGFEAGWFLLDAEECEEADQAKNVERGRDENQNAPPLLVLHGGHGGDQPVVVEATALGRQPSVGLREDGNDHV